VGEVTVGELATALEGFYLTVLTGAGNKVHGQVADADEFAEALHATLGRMTALREPARTGPGYYQGAGGMQPFDVIDAFGLDFYEGNVVKYVCRWRKKNGLEDLRKARTYIGEVIKRAEALGWGEGAPAPD
jgi:uncharacterized protein DUF3310